MPEDSSPTGRKEVDGHMGRMKDIAVTLMRVEQLANELIVLSERPCRETRAYARVLAEVGEIAWKLVDAVRQD